MSGLSAARSIVGKTHPRIDSESTCVTGKRSILFNSATRFDPSKLKLEVDVFKRLALVAIVFSAFTMPAMLYATVIPAITPQPATLAANAGGTMADVTRLRSASGTNLIDPAGTFTSDSMPAANSSVRNITFEDGDDGDYYHTRKGGGDDGDYKRKGGAPTPEPSSILLFGVGLSALMRRVRRASKDKQSATNRNNSNS
jgi:hypothetical protein